ncbi:MAG: RDD family protein [Ferruginibacter sp.]
MEENNSPIARNEQEDLLSGDAYIDNHFVYASQGQRFLNWLIDNILMRFGLAYLTGMGIGFILSIAAPDFLSNIANSDSPFGPLFFLGIMIGYLDYIIYYTLCEKLFKGYTLGKVITGTRAIRQDGGELTFRNAILRSLSRCVPFEVFSGFSTLTWHDDWTDTMVIKAR